MSKFLFAVAICLAAAGQVDAQNIKGHYVAKAETDGTVYHTFPSTLFENRELGDLTFDITYKSASNRPATVNFTYFLKGSFLVDSVRFVCGPTRMGGPAQKLYMTPEKKVWKCRYTTQVDLKSLYVFFDADAKPTVTLYSQGRAFVYQAKPSAWKSYAPIGYKIFDMIRMNEPR